MSGLGKLFGSKKPLDPPNTNVPPPVVIPQPNPEEPKTEHLLQGLVDNAGIWIGTKEVGKNGGKVVNSFQHVVGLSTGDAWCMAFVQYCIKTVEDGALVRSVLKKSGHCLTVWESAPASAKSKTPFIGAIVIWQHGTSSNGHTGIVRGIEPDGTLVTIEGNTGPEDHVNSNGDGVYLKHRSPKGSGDMHIVGYLKAFA